MKLIAGLGNPGKDYVFTRHNMGFMAIDMLSQQENIRVDRLRCRSLCGEGFIEGQKVMLLKPQTYMNLSGEAVRMAADYYKIEPKDIIVIYDDVSLPEGHIRLRSKGSAGGHNGIKSIILSLDTDVFPRIKLGVGSPRRGEDDLADFVLDDIPKASQRRVFAQLERCCDALRAILRDGMASAMNDYNNNAENGGEEKNGDAGADT